MPKIVDNSISIKKNSEKMEETFTFALKINRICIEVIIVESSEAVISVKM